MSERPGDPTGTLKGAPGGFDERTAGPPRPGSRIRVVRELLVHRREQILFLVVGGWNTLFGYAIFALLYWLLHTLLPVTAILLVSYAVAFINNFLCYKYIVFRTRGGHVGEILRFMVVYVPILLANLIVLPLALRTLPLNAYVVQGIYTVVVVLLSYLGLKLFTFRDPGEQSTR